MEQADNCQRGSAKDHVCITYGHRHRPEARGSEVGGRWAKVMGGMEIYVIV